MRVLRRLSLFWRSHPPAEDIDFGAAYREPWIEQSLRDFEQVLQDIEKAPPAFRRTVPASSDPIRRGNDQGRLFGRWRQGRPREKSGKSRGSV